jgi:hypothetical protein
VYILNNMQVKGIVFTIDKAEVGRDNSVLRTKHTQHYRCTLTANHDRVFIKQTFNLRCEAEEIIGNALLFSAN